jgi:L-iditol 2-dehydrogenase
MTLITLNNAPIPEKMHAIVLKKPFQLKETEIPVWPIEKYNDSDLVLIQVGICGVCGSDYRYYQGENPWAQHTKGIHVENPPNIVLGHEYAGTVIAVLSEENREWLGKRVVAICSKVCGECDYCITGRAHLCESTIHMGHGQGWGHLDYYPGAYAEFAPAWAAGCYEIPQGVSYEDAAMMDVLAVCAHAFTRAPPQADTPVLISGCGPIGNGIGQVARNSGMDDDQLIILERSEVAMKVAQECGFHNVINTSGKRSKEIIARILQISESKKVYSIFDTIGTDLSFNVGMAVLDKGGTFVNLAVHDQTLETFNQMQLASERAITTSSNFSLGAYERAWGWLKEGKFLLEPWYTRISLQEVPKMFQRVVDGKESKSYFKLVVDPRKRLDG